uniref:Uncharacterized protein n=1 Tax=Panagrolaimus sp. ES5 TaxID=591445 RepID=A0AC34G3J0_9BILA
MMLESNWKETNDSKIEFKFLSFKLAKIIVDLIYGKVYWGILEKVEYIRLYQFADQYDIIALKFADQYDIIALKNAVKNSLVLTPLNIVEYTNLVAETKIDEFIRYCIDYLILCSQYSFPIKDSESITDSVKLQIADRVFSSPFLKRNVEDENVYRMSKHSIKKENENVDPFGPHICALPELQMPSLLLPNNVPLDFNPFLEFLLSQMQQQKPLEEYQQQFLIWQQQQLQQWQIMMNDFALKQQPF